jgi:hypothetical protein
MKMREQCEGEAAYFRIPMPIARNAFEIAPTNPHAAAIQAALRSRIGLLGTMLGVLALMAWPCRAEEFVATSPSGETRIEWTSDRELGWSLALFRKGRTPVEVPFKEPDFRYESLGLSNFYERRFLWMGERYCVTTLSYGFGILDTQKNEWLCNTGVEWGFAHLRHTIAYVRFRPGGGTPTGPDTLGIYRFTGTEKDPDLSHHETLLAGRVVSPIFESRYEDQVAFIQRSAKGLQLVIFDTDAQKVLATRAVPKRFAGKENLWSDEFKKAGRNRNRALLEWMEAATKYGPFWEPQPDGF